MQSRLVKSIHRSWHLHRVGQEWTIVIVVGHTVSVRVVVAVVAQPVVVGVQLVSVLHAGTVVDLVGHAVQVPIGPGVAGVTDEVVVEIELVGVKGRQAVVAGVADSVAVTVLLSNITYLSEKRDQ